MMYFKTTIPVYILIISVNTMYLRMTKCFFEDDLHLEPCCQYAFYRMKQFLPGDKVTLFMITSFAWYHTKLG